MNTQTSGKVLRQGARSGTPYDRVILDHQERHLRRRRLKLVHGDEVLVNLPRAELLEHGDMLVLDDGRLVEVVAAKEDLHEVTGHSASEIAELAWHIGNRHLAAQIEADRILILRDAVIAGMLAGLGAHVRNVSEPFHPVRGAYSGHGGGHGHTHGGHGDHSHGGYGHEAHGHEDHGDE